MCDTLFRIALPIYAGIRFCFEDMNGAGRYYSTKHGKCPHRVAYPLPMSSGYCGSTQSSALQRIVSISGNSSDSSEALC